MKKVGRWLFNLAVLVSVAAWLLFLGSWIWSWRHHTIVWFSVGHELIVLRLYGTGPQLIAVQDWQPAEPFHVLSYVRARGDDGFVGPSEPDFAVPVSQRGSRPVILMSLFGLSVEKQPATVFIHPSGPLGSMGQSIFTLPAHNTLWFDTTLWGSLIYPGVLPAIWLSFMLYALPRRWRAARRKSRGLCQNCGYDLRATPDRCPECGAVTKALPIDTKS